MVATLTLTNQMLDLVAADPATLAPAVNGLKVGLIKEDFGELNALVLADVVEATFTGYARLTLPVAVAPQVATDPDTGRRCILLPDPAGGLVWYTTADAGLPMTIYGHFVINNGGTQTYEIRRWQTPVALTGIDQFVEVPSLKLFLVEPGLESVGAAVDELG